jgi:tripartite-type tricarboxylate transporter receptor subunit TctC
MHGHLRTAPSILFSAALILTGAVALTATAAVAQSGADFYKGKTLTYIVTTEPGGGHDYYARLMARHMEKQLPGVTIIVKNVPGAGHMIGTNMLYGAKPDGLTIGTFSTGVTYAQVVGLEGAKFDLTKMEWIGKQASDTRVLFMSSNAPYKNWDDVINTKRTIMIGSTGIGSGGYNESYMLAHAWNLDMKVLPGYSGDQQYMAMARGEMDGRVIGASTVMEDSSGIDPGVGVIQFGEALPNVTDGLKIAGTPLQKTVAGIMQSQSEIYRLVAAPPGTPKARLDSLREAFKKAHMSPEYRAEATAANRPFDEKPMEADEVSRLVKLAIDVGPDMTNLLKQITAKPK